MHRYLRTREDPRKYRQTMSKPSYSSSKFPRENATSILPSKSTSFLYTVPPSASYIFTPKLRTFLKLMHPTRSAPPTLANADAGPCLAQSTFYNKSKFFYAASNFAFLSSDEGLTVERKALAECRLAVDAK